MNNSVETILGDIKKLFKELEKEYGKVKPQLCDVTGVDKCPNTKCWVQSIRDEYHERVCDLERVILISINSLSEANACLNNKIVAEAIQNLDRIINPTPCQDCSKNNSCTSSYKSHTIHSEPCEDFSKSFDNKEVESKIAIHF